MIVKIKHEDSWVVYDNFVKVRYSHFRGEEANNIAIENFDANWISSKPYIEMQPEPTIVSINARLKSDTNEHREFTILANEKVYLLTDEGKTIERIN